MIAKNSVYNTIFKIHFSDWRIVFAINTLGPHLVGVQSFGYLSEPGFSGLEVWDVYQTGMVECIRFTIGNFSKLYTSIS